MVRGSCPSVTHRFVVLAHAHFLSTAIPVAYRWVKRLNSHSPHPWQTPASSFKSLYRKRANAPCSCVQLAHSRFRYNTKTNRELTGTHIGTLGFGSRSLGHYSPECDDLFIASNGASASSGRARTTKSSVKFTQRTFPDESIRNSAGREMSAPSRRPCTCTRSHLRITSSCASERIGNV